MCSAGGSVPRNEFKLISPGLNSPKQEILDTMYWFSYAKSFKETCIEPLMYVFDEFIIFAIPSELPRLLNSHQLLDGTFKHTNSLNNFKQTYIISLKYEIPDDRVFIYPVVMTLMRNKSEASYRSIFQKLTRVHNDWLTPKMVTYTSCTGKFPCINCI